MAVGIVSVKDAGNPVNARNTNNIFNFTGDVSVVTEAAEMSVCFSDTTELTLGAYIVIAGVRIDAVSITPDLPNEFQFTFEDAQDTANSLATTISSHPAFANWAFVVSERDDTWCVEGTYQCDEATIWEAYAVGGASTDVLPIVSITNGTISLDLNDYAIAVWIDPNGEKCDAFSAVYDPTEYSSELPLVYLNADFSKIVASKVPSSFYIPTAASLIGEANSTLNTLAITALPYYNLRA